MKVVVDTNVLVSAFINANGTPAKILSLILNRKIKILYDNRIIFEYTEVLTRKEFGFILEIIKDMIEFIKHEGEYIVSEHSDKNFIDEKDKKFYEVFKTGNANT